MRLVQATLQDVPQIEQLLYEVHKVHSLARPDLFKEGEKKYSTKQIEQLIANCDTPIYVYKQEGKVLGYAFIIYMVPKAQSLVDIKTMYVDDFCISSDSRHMGIGSKIFDELKIIAKQQGCYNILLNVYNFNTVAYNFYKKQDMQELKTYMEWIVK